MARVDLRHSEISGADFKGANMYGLKLPDNSSSSSADNDDIDY
tara:strand:- start:2280 stop:2408 length:129 start_codon:yes stop_codon:yes gene_type:complete